MNAVFFEVLHKRVLFDLFLFLSFVNLFNDVPQVYVHQMHLYFISPIFLYKYIFNTVQKM